MTQKLEIRNYEVLVRLGCYPAEQDTAQPVIFGVTLHFDGELKCALTDRLEDAIDYVKLMDLIRMASQAKPFALLEHLNFTAAMAVAEFLSAGSIRGNMQMDTRKVRVPVNSLRDGVTVSCEIKF